MSKLNYVARFSCWFYGVKFIFPRNENHLKASVAVVTKKLAVQFRKFSNFISSFAPVAFVEIHCLKSHKYVHIIFSVQIAVPTRFKM